MPGLIIAAPASGSGKTVITLGLLRHLRRRDVRVSAFKAGPDYIDPAFHTAATGRPCGNMDPWAMRPAVLGAEYRRAATDADLVIGEGVMGLFDGAGGGAGSTAELAARLRLPVVLVVDVRGQAASAAAVIEGFARHRPDVTVVGAICNRVAGERHARLIAEACTQVPLGFVPRDGALELPERHLGLIQASEHPRLEAFLDCAAEIVGSAVDIDRLIRLARKPNIDTGAPPLSPPRLGGHIALASDSAFRFTYEHWRTGWAAAGVAVSPFSPLADEAPHLEADAVWLPGGYPELHAGRLAENRRFLEGLRAAARRGAAIHGECGGYMVLGERLVDKSGRRYGMAGLLPLETDFSAPRLHLGYRVLALRDDSSLGRAGSIWRGHEFHYASVLQEDHSRARPLFDWQAPDGDSGGVAGLRRGCVSGSFCHLVDRAPPDSAGD